MRRLLLLVTVALVLAVLAVMAAGPVLAQELTEPHQHFLTVPGTGEEQQVAGGTGECESNLTALNEVHSNVHLGQPTETGQLEIRAAETQCPPS
jgi:hypothetical protein